MANEFEVKFRGRIGPDVRDDKSIRLLNRMFEWTDEGIIVEGDQRHAEIIAQQCGVDGDAKSVATPGEVNEAGNDQELSPEHATTYRANVARGNFLSQDRSDFQFAVKELNRSMSRPTDTDWNKLKRLVRYLKDKTRSRILYECQGPVKGIINVTVFTDSDFAGCRKTRRSSGVVFFVLY